MSAKKESGVELLAALGVTLVLAPVAVLTRGWALTFMWKWFVVPPFGLPPLTIATAIGLSFIIGFLTGSKAPDRKDEENDTFLQKTTVGMLRGITVPLIMLGLAWVFHLFL